MTSLTKTFIPSAGVESPGRHSAAEGVHRRVEEVLHAVRHPAQALLPAGDHPDGQAGQQQEDQRGGQHRTQGEREREREREGGREGGRGREGETLKERVQETAENKESRNNIKEEYDIVGKVGEMKKRWRVRERHMRVEQKRTARAVREQAGKRPEDQREGQRRKQSLRVSLKRET